MHPPSQQAWLTRQINDPFAAQASAHGYRSRAAYKLTEIDDRFRLLKPGVRMVDLGLAPGGWTQVAIERGVTFFDTDPEPAGTRAARPEPQPWAGQRLRAKVSERSRSGMPKR